jgi:hypothetical protein
VPRYVFEVKVAGAVRVRAADESEARKVVAAVLLLPGPDEVRMANDSNGRIGWDHHVGELPCEGGPDARQQGRQKDQTATPLTFARQLASSRLTTSLATCPKCSDDIQA